MFIQATITILTTNVARLIFAFLWNRSDPRERPATRWMIRVLLNTELTSVTRLRTANPTALSVRRALAKQVMTKRWWTSSLLGCACKTMSRASAR